MGQRSGGRAGLAIIGAVAALSAGCSRSNQPDDAGARLDRGADHGADEGPDAGPTELRWEPVGDRLPGIVYDVVSIPGVTTLAAVRPDFDFTQTLLYELDGDRWVGVPMPFARVGHAPAADYLDQWNDRPIAAGVSVDDELVVYERNGLDWSELFRRPSAVDGGVLRIRTRGDALLVHVNPWLNDEALQSQPLFGRSEVFYAVGDDVTELPLPPPACGSDPVVDETFVLDETGVPWVSYKSPSCDLLNGYLSRWDGERWVTQWSSVTDRIDVSTGYDPTRGVALGVVGRRFTNGPSRLCELGPEPTDCVRFALSDLECETAAHYRPTTPLRVLPDGRVFCGLVEQCCVPGRFGLPECSIAAGWAALVDGRVVDLPTEEWVYVVEPDGPRAILAGIGEEVFRLRLP